MQMPAPSVPTTQTGTVTSTFEADVLCTDVTITDGQAQSIDIVKVRDYDKPAVIALASYDSDGNMLDLASVTEDLSSATVNQKHIVPITLDIAQNAEKVRVIIFDSMDTLNVLSPSKEYTLTNGIQSFAVFDKHIAALNANLIHYKGKQSMIMVTPNDVSDITADDITYINQEIITADSYQSIPLFGIADGKCKIRVGIPGEDMITETFSTIINFLPDAEEDTNTIYKNTFSSQNDTAIASRNAAYNAAKQAIQMTASDNGGTGTVFIPFDNPICITQGQTVTVKFGIAYGKNSGRYMNYSIKDKNGNELIYSHINAYSANDQTMSIGGVNKMAVPSVLPPAFSKKSNLASEYTTFTNVFDFASNTATITVSSSGGTEIYTGRLQDDADASIQSLEFTSNHQYAERSCYVDDIALTATQ